MIHNSIVIFTDGSSRGNPGPGGYAAIIIFPAGQNNNGGEIQDSRFKIKELGGREGHTTNNRMELTAAIQALSFISSNSTLNAKRLTLFTDSSYLINGITKWIYGWQKNGWKTMTKQPVENRDLWESLDKQRAGKDIVWKLVKGHIGVVGNDRADEIATGFADGLKPKLYEWPIEKYPIKDILDIKIDEEKKIKKSEDRSRSRVKAYSYVSLVNGVIKVDKTWTECEARVKGKSGVKYKKALSAEEEKSIIESWNK